MTQLEQSLTEDLTRCENDKAGWMRQHNLLAQEVRVIKAALSFDPTVDRDLETCARRHFHGHAESLKAAERLADEVVQMTFVAKGWEQKYHDLKAMFAFGKPRSSPDGG